MAFCRNCGAKLEEGKPFCSSCGTRAADTGPGSPAYDVQNDKLMAILAYFGPLVFIPIFVARESRFVRFHANQGFTLFLAWVVSVVLGRIFWPFGWLIGVAVFVFALLGIIYAAQGREQELPFIGGLRLVDSLFG